MQDMYDTVEKVLLGLLVGWTLMVCLFARAAWVNWHRPLEEESEGTGIANEGIGGT